MLLSGFKERTHCRFFKIDHWPTGTTLRLVSIVLRFLIFTLSLLANLSAATFSSWQAAQFTPAQLALPAISGATANPDADPFDNVSEYAFGLNPFAYSPAPQSGLVFVNGRLQLTYRRPLSVTDLVYLPQVSPDLGNWYSGDDSIETISSTEANGWQTVTVRDRSTGEAARFIRIQAAFDTDQDGLPDDWEMRFFGNLDHLAGDDEDFDTLTNLMEYHRQSSPKDYYNNQPPALTVLGANPQTAQPGEWLAEPLTVLVTGKNGSGLVNAPVTFSLISGAGTLSSSSVRTDSQGQAMVAFQNAPSEGTATIAATANFGNEGSRTVEFVARSQYPPKAADGVSVTKNADGSMDMTWEDRSDNEEEFVIRVRNHQTGGWEEIGSVPANVTNVHIGADHTLTWEAP